MKKKTFQLEPQDFKLETTSVWSFPYRGDWATHDSKYRGNFSPYIPRNVILRYSKENDLVLDQFLGGGTTAIEAKLLNRNFIGIDINQESIDITKEKLKFDVDNNASIELYKSDARDLNKVEDNSIDLICTHPPYADIIKYSDIKEDLSLLKIDDFLIEIEKVAKECYRVLKEGKFCSILIGDIRKNGFVKPLGFRTMEVFNKVGFLTKEIVIKEQHNCRMTNFYKSLSLKNNFLLLAHEYLFVFKK